MRPFTPCPSTFSIVGFDPSTGDLGIAVQSKFIAVGAVVPWAKAGVGAIATQSYANTAYGPQGLALLARGRSAQETINALTAADDDRALRQVGIVSARGDAASFTGESCHDWAGGIVGDHYCCQGNILVSDQTVQAMAATFEATTGSLADKLLAALAAGQAAGGDKRGQQSAALRVVREKGGYAGFNDILYDLRVDDHAAPIDELTRLYGLYNIYFSKADPADLLEITPQLASEIQQALTHLGFYSADINGQYSQATQDALRDFCGIENLEERWQEGNTLDPEVLNFLRRKYRQAGP
ncbi:MAG: DUF1028 domain-containing protein [Anaerolineae bacterium]